MQNANEQGEILSPSLTNKKVENFAKNFLNAWSLRDILLILHSEKINRDQCD